MTREIEELIERLHTHTNELQRQYRLFHIREHVKGRRTVSPLPQHSQYRFTFGSPQKLKYVSGWDGTEFKIKLIEELVRKLLLKISFIALFENSQLRIEADALALYRERNTLSSIMHGWRNATYRRLTERAHEPGYDEEEEEEGYEEQVGDGYVYPEDNNSPQSIPLTVSGQRTWGVWEEIATSSLNRSRSEDEGETPLTTEELGGQGEGYPMYPSDDQDDEEEGDPEGSEFDDNGRLSDGSPAPLPAEGRPETRLGVRRWAGVRSKGPSTRPSRGTVAQEAVVSDGSDEQEAAVGLSGDEAEDEDPVPVPSPDWGPGGVPDYRGTIYEDRGVASAESTGRVAGWASADRGAVRSPEQVDPDKVRMAQDIVSAVGTARISLEAIRARHPLAG
ncbi:hypothetical protein J8273_1354 [Carpediemonas membranifera]|uniref:Uncharacterized protein n=1 Tax=Carpediemonas membranifera TaxID=201153 RepID=A0A8J6AY74_9EUKA|nr:hypothetical protein J8273_1354 [Carpediemonas membranifera]|eukprot:KAG9397003.1 hypothetical protein J8273_1354 [Carpediemonas membranifera]